MKQAQALNSDGRLGTLIRQMQGEAVEPGEDEGQALLHWSVSSVVFASEERVGGSGWE